MKKTRKQAIDRNLLFHYTKKGEPKIMERMQFGNVQKKKKETLTPESWRPFSVWFSTQSLRLRGLEDGGRGGRGLLILAAGDGEGLP